MDLRTRLLCLIPVKMSARYMDEWLRAFDPPIIARVEQDKVFLDVRTIQDEELKTVARAIKDLASMTVE